MRKTYQRKKAAAEKVIGSLNGSITACGEGDGSALRDGAGKGSAESQWQDIETAPKDGTIIWVYGGFYDVPIEKLADGDFWQYEKKLGKKTVTHWMPRMTPPPPKGE
ncbi:MAG: hypothetical protein L3J33_03370 [Rhodobacteraceae bacterium]|nr:hypothetical protein [Paracoccaceae bacterium]